MSSDIEDHITTRYEIKKRLGKGAYGIVWKAIDKKTGEVVALKKIFDAFRNQTDAQRTFREIMFLQEFGDHANIIKLHNVMKAENDKDIYLVFEFMDTDLHNVIKRGNILKDVHKRYITYQILKATKYMHSGNVIHRDQKPSNILLDGECFVKVCDFGLARSLSQITVDEDGDPNLTEYVATRWYRAPEILLASHRYTKGVDMWSVGCIVGEMIVGKPLFPGSSTLNQIERIMGGIDIPTKEDIESVDSGYGSSVLDRAAKKPRKPLSELLAGAPADAIDLLQKLLQFNPDKRLTAEQALKHPYVRRFHNPAEERNIGRNVVPPLSDDIQLTVEEYRSKLYEMIMQKKLERRRKKRDDVKPEESNEQVPPSEPAPMEKSPSPNNPKSPAMSPRPHTKYSPGMNSPIGRPPPSHPDNKDMGEKSPDRQPDNKSTIIAPAKPVQQQQHGGVAFGRTTHPTPGAPAAFQGRPKSQAMVRQKSAENVSHVQGSSRPPTRHTSAPVVGRTPGGVHVRTHSAGFSQQAANPVIMRDDHRGPLGVTSNRMNNQQMTAMLYPRRWLPMIPHQRPPSGKERFVRPVPVYGRKQYDNTRNAPSSGALKNQLGGYSQSYGTINASTLASLQKKW